MDTWRDGRGTHQEPPHKTSHKRPYGCLPGTGGLAFEPEPGFYIGAMYISYAFTTGIVLMVGLLVYHLLGDPDTWVYVASVTVAVVGLLPLLLRSSRTVLLYFFGGANYDPQAVQRRVRPNRAMTNPDW